MRCIPIAVLVALTMTAPAWAASGDHSFGLSGDWGGIRAALANDGITFPIKAYFEGAYNPAGGTSRTAAGEIDLGVIGDLGKLANDPGGKVELTITDRYGAALGSAAGIDPLMEVQDLYGRGDIWRLTQLSFAQSFFGKALNIKGGRLDPGMDFDHLACHFQNLTFCGAQPGNMVGSYWYNAPVSEWGGRVKLNLPRDIYAEVGAYQVNPINLVHGFTFDTSHATGTLIPVEIGWKPKHGLTGLPATYKIGAWYSTTHAADLFDDANGAPKALTGLPGQNRRGLYGFYVSLKHQVTGVAGPMRSGLSLFLHYAEANRSTAVLDRQLALGGSYRGLLAERPRDSIALALGATHVNDRAAATEELADAAGFGITPIQHTEYVSEIDYRARLLHGLTLTPNLQVIDDPGGVSARPTAVVIGLRLDVML